MKHPAAMHKAILMGPFRAQIGFLALIMLKVEKILKGSLDSIPPPSPSVKIQIMERESLLEV